MGVFHVFKIVQMYHIAQRTTYKTSDSQIFLNDVTTLLFRSVMITLVQIDPKA